MTMGADNEMGDVRPAEAAPDIEAEAQRQKTALLYRNAGVALAVTIAIASLLAYVDATLHTAAGATFVWWCVVVATAVGRYELARRFRARERDAAAAPMWRQRYLVATALLAVAWGAGSALLLWSAPDRALLFTGLVLGGMVAGAVPILGPVPAAFRTFALLVCLPTSARILLQADSPLHWAFGFMTVVFLVAMLASARFLHQTIDAALRLGLEKERLAVNLAESEARYRIVSAMSSDLIYSCSREQEGAFSIDWLAGSCEQLFGLDADRLQAEDLWRCSVADDEMPFGQYVAALVPGQPEECELLVRHTDGSVRYMRAISKLLRPATGAERYRLYGSFQDITERKRAEIQLGLRTQDLSRSNEELKLTLESLQQAQKHLVESEKMAALGGLVAGVAHEINTPVGVGVTAASTLEDETRRLTALYRQGQMKKTDLEQYVAVAEQSSRMILNNLGRAAELINSFKQVAVDQSSESRRRFKVRAYLEDILTSLRPALKKTGVSYAIDCAEEIEIDSYPGMFSQIITNLVMNSLTHAHDERPGGAIRIVVRKPDDRLELEFSDDGKGMSPDVLAKIFDPFFTTKRGVGGSGLGLHTVYNLITQTLKGSIGCRSQPGQGTTFAIQWPLAEPQLDSRSPGGAAPPEPPAPFVAPRFF